MLSSVLCFVNSKEKMEALFVLDVLEGTGLQVLSRRNIQCIILIIILFTTHFTIDATELTLLIS